MRHSRIFPTIQALSITAIIAMLAGCANGGALLSAPRPAPQAVTTLGDRDARAAFQFGPLDKGFRASRNRTSIYSCPATGPIEYVSDATNGVINVFAGDFNGQSECGQISSGISEAVGMTVDETTHDLYVANWKGGNVLVFHRGQTTPYNSYTDPSGQYPSDVAVAKDGTIAASNSYCSFSTWKAGPHGGTYIANYAKPGCRFALDITFLTVTDDDTVYYMSDIPGPNRSRLWAASCPGGFCGVPAMVPGVVFDFFPAGLAMDETGDLVAIKMSAYGRDNDAATYELPNPKPISFDLENGSPFGLAIDENDRHLFVCDPNTDSAYEYAYPSGTLLGTVSGIPYGFIGGIAADD